MQEAELPFVVKICGITCEEDARAAIEAGANALGFNFYTKSPRYVKPGRAREIVRSVDGEYWRVGVFVNATEEELIAISDEVGLDVLQLHGERTVVPSSRAFRVWLSVTGGVDTPAHDHRIEAYLLDSFTPAYGGSGRTFLWSQAAGFPYRAIVAGGLDATNVAEAIAALRPWGVDACSRLESVPGRKDAHRVRAFVRAAAEASGSVVGQGHGHTQKESFLL